MPELDWDALARNNQLSSLTLVELRVYLAKHQLKMSGTKPQIVERIAADLGQR